MNGLPLSQLIDVLRRHMELFGYLFVEFRLVGTFVGPVFESVEKRKQ